ncbi:MAG: ChaN family lipoprotein [Verrucomicrobiota bacterium]
MRKIARVIIGLIVFVFLSGCVSTRSSSPAPAAPSKPVFAWSIFLSDGSESDLPALLESFQTADIILIGERHDDPVGHEIKHMMTEALLEATPNAAVAMEMFERDEQGIVDLYISDQISTESLMKTTDARSWEGRDGQWLEWYQPIVDSVKSHYDEGARIIAANSPRTYVKLARLEDFSALQTLADNGNTSFAVPDTSVDDSAYEQKFRELMGFDGESGSHGNINLEAFFRAQQVWDASMANSVVSAKSIHPKVMLVAGDFHVADKGGTLIRIRDALPEAKIIAISIQPKTKTKPFDAEDEGSADYIIYTAQIFKEQ